MQNLFSRSFWVGTSSERGAFSAALVGSRFYATDTNELHLWTGAGWTKIGPGSGGGAAWGEISGMLSNQNDLQSALDGKAPSSHGHVEADITSLISDLAGKSAVGHGHSESDVTSLVTDLAGKAPSSHTHTESQVSNLLTDLAGKAALSHSHTQAESHNSADTDTSATALHHTLGAGQYQAAAGNHTHGGGSVIGYAINVQALTSSPTDGQTVYFGMLPKAPVTTANISKCYVRAAGTIERVEIYCYSGTAGTAESWSLYLRKNNTTDYLIATLAVATSERVFSNASLNISMATGDYFEIKGVQPTWATNPLTTIYGGYVYIE